MSCAGEVPDEHLLRAELVQLRTPRRRDRDPAGGSAGQIAELGHAGDATPGRDGNVPLGGVASTNRTVER